MDFLTKYKTATAQLAADGKFQAFASGARMLNAALTFAFGFSYGADFFPTPYPTLSGLLGGFAYTLILDAAAYGWGAAQDRKGISPRQRLIASQLSTASMWASSGMSLAYIILTTRLVDLSAIHEPVGLIALAITSGLLLLHFVRLFEYHASSPEALQSQARSEFDAALSQMLLDQEEQFNAKVMQRMEDYLLDHVDEFAAMKADQAWKRISTQMGKNEDFKVATPTKDSKASSSPPPQSSPRAEAKNAATAESFIEYEKLTGNARAAAQNNLNIAAG